MLLNRRYLTNVFIVLLSLLLLALSACSGDSAGRAGAEANPAGAPAAMLAGLPPLSSLGAGSAPRGASTADEQELAGDVLFRSSPSSVTVDAVNHKSVFAPANGQLGFAVQEFDLLADDPVASVAIELAGVDSGEKVWVAIANYASGAWETLQPDGDGSYNIDLGGVAGSYSNGSKMYIAVLGWKASFELLLTRLTLATGFYPGWAHTWGDAGVDIGSRLAIDADGNILFAGSYGAYDVTADDYTRSALLQMSHNGQLLQAKTYQIFDDVSFTESLLFGELLRKDDGTLYLVGRNTGTSAGEDGVIIKLDSALNILWARLYDTGADDDIICAALKSNGDLVCAGETLYADDNFLQDPWVITVNGNTGELLSSQVYELVDTSEIVRYIDLDEAGGKILLAGDIDGNDLIGDAFFMSLPLAGGAPNWAAQYGGPDSDYATGICRAGNGTAVAAVNFENVNESVFLTIESDGALTLESGYSDEDGAVGLSVWRVVYNQASGGPQMAGLRIDEQGNGVGNGVTSLIQFDADLGPLSGITYGWYFVDWRYTPTSLYTAGFTGLGAALAPTVNIAGAGSLTGKAGSGSYVLLSPVVSFPSGGSSTAEVAELDTPDFVDREITLEGDQDFQMVRFETPL